MLMSKILWYYHNGRILNNVRREKLEIKYMQKLIYDKIIICFLSRKEYVNPHIISFQVDYGLKYEIEK